jgi:4-amino-4-deoxy-L-arabinose transferase-like glycosyltransferase
VKGRIGRAGERRHRPPQAFVWLVLGAVAASRFFAIAASPGEIDEAVFAGAVTRFDLFDLSPQAPGFPVWILLGRVLLPICVTPFNALATASTILAAGAGFALWAWGRRVVGSWAALAGVVFAFALPVVWINGGRAFSDMPATALFLAALACLATAEERRSPNQTRWREMIAARRARLLAIAAGLLAAAGAGVRPHLVLAFGPALLLWAFRLALRWDRRDAVLSFLGSGLAGTAAWLVWLIAQAGGAPGLFASLSERAGFRAHAFATGTFGTLADSFLVRDFLSPRRAAFVILVAVIGFATLGLRRRRGAMELLVVLVPTFLSLWFLHSRAMSRYSIPFVLVLALAAGAGLEGVFRKGPLAFLVALLAGGLYAREAWPDVLLSAHEETPPIAAIRALERWVHPGRETIVADEDFHAFLRMERWEGRLVAWGYTDAEIASAPRQTNRRLVRLADFTAEPEPPDRRDAVWSTWLRGGRVAEMLGNRRLLVVATRDPAPPLFGPGFGVKESAAGRPSFRWAGPSARLIVAADQGPPAATLSGERPGQAGPTTLTVTEARSGRVLVSRTVEPGPFELTILDRPVFGPMPGPSEYVIACDRPADLPPLEGAARPAKGCFTFLEATFSRPPERIWMRQGGRLVADLGAPDDGRYDPDGFWGREKIADTGLDLRWTKASASVAWAPVPGFAPGRVILRARAVAEPKDVSIFVNGVLAGAMRVGPSLSETSSALSPVTARLLAGLECARIEIRARAEVPKSLGKGDDARALGVAVDRISLE